MEIDSEQLREAVRNAVNSFDYNFLYYQFIEPIQKKILESREYPIQNESLMKVYFEEACPIFFYILGTTRKVPEIIYFIGIYCKLSSHLIDCSSYHSIQLLSNIAAYSQQFDDSLFLSYNQIQINNNTCAIDKAKCNLNIFGQIFINFIILENIIPKFIMHLEVFNSENYNEEIFRIFNVVFLVVKKEQLSFFDNCFKQILTIIKKNLEQHELVSLARSLMFCSNSYIEFYFNSIMFSLNCQKSHVGKDEILKLISKSIYEINNILITKEDGKYIYDSFDDFFDKNFKDIILLVKDDIAFLYKLIPYISKKKEINMDFLNASCEKNVVLHNVFFNFIKDNYTADAILLIINDSINKEKHADITCKFMLKVMNFNFDLIENKTDFFQYVIINITISMALNIKNFLIREENNRFRENFYKAISECDYIGNDQFLLATEILSVLHPTEFEINYIRLNESILLNIDSILLTSFYMTNKFIKLPSLEILLDLIPPSHDLFALISEQNTEFFDTSNIQSILRYNIPLNEKTFFDDNTIFSEFLWNIFDKTKDIQLLMKLIIQSKLNEKAIKKLVKSYIKDNPIKCQSAIVDKINGGYIQHFLNFDYSLYEDISVDDNPLYLVFNKPQESANNSLVSFASNVRYFLNHNHENVKVIEENQILSLFSVPNISNKYLKAFIFNIGIDLIQFIKLNNPDQYKHIYEQINWNEIFQISLETKYKVLFKKILSFLELIPTNTLNQITHDTLSNILTIGERSFIYFLQKIQDIALLYESLDFHNLLLNFFDTPENLHLIHYTHFNIPLDFIIKSKNISKYDLFEFIKNKRITDTGNFIKYIFSSNFPQVFRTKRFFNLIFENYVDEFIYFISHIECNKGNFLHVPIISGTEFFNAYKAISLIIPDFSNFNSSEISNFFAEIIFSRQKYINCPLILSTYNDHCSSLESTINFIFQHLPSNILSNFEYQYQLFNKIEYSSIVNLSSSILTGMNISNRDFFSLSDLLNSIKFLKYPKLLLIKNASLSNLTFENHIKINTQKYCLECFLTEDRLYTPSNKLNEKFISWSNGLKTKTNNDISNPIFLFYKEVPRINTSFDLLTWKNLEKVKKFKSAKLPFNPYSIICDALELGYINWSKINASNNIFEIALHLFTKFNYTPLFESLESNPNFVKFFFSHELNVDPDISHFVVEISKNYPDQEKLIDILFESANNSKNKDIIQSILINLDLDNIKTEKLINRIISKNDNSEKTQGGGNSDNINMPFSSSNAFLYDFSDFIADYYRKPSTTNKLLLQHSLLAEIVLQKLSNNNKITNINDLMHLMSPMTDDLFLKFIHYFKNKFSLESLLKQYSSSTLLIRLLKENKQFAYKPDDFSNIFLNLTPCKDLKEYYFWIEDALSSKNALIRNHGYQLIKEIFSPEDLPQIQNVLQQTLIRTIFETYFNSVQHFICDYFGNEFIMNTKFSNQIWSKFFETYNYPKSYEALISFLNSIPTPDKILIRAYNELVKTRIDTDIGLKQGTELLILAMRCKYSPSPTEFNDIISNIIYRLNFDDTTKIFYIFKSFLKDENIFDYEPLILALEKLVPFYIPFIQSLLSFPSAYETDLFIIFLLSPIIVIQHNKIINDYFSQYNMNDVILIRALETAITTLNRILEGKCTRTTTLSSQNYKLYANYFIPYLKKYDFYIISFLSNKSKHLWLEYILKSSFVFPEILQHTLQQIIQIQGINLFQKEHFVPFQKPWAEFICSIIRQYFADSKLDSNPTINGVSRSIIINKVFSEMNSELCQFNTCEKEYLLFAIGVFNNNELNKYFSRTDNIFLALRGNKALQYVGEFIKISMQKFTDFFNNIEVKNFIIKLTINDPLLSEKLSIFDMLLEHSRDNMKPIISNNYDLIENLYSEIDENSPNSAIMNRIFEHCLELLDVV